MPSSSQYEKNKDYYVHYRLEHAEERRDYQRKRRGSTREPRYINDAIRLLKDFQVCVNMKDAKEHIKACKSQFEVDRYVRALIDKKLKSV